VETTNETTNVETPASHLPEMPAILKEEKTNEDVELKTLGWYNKELSAKLPKNIFDAEPTRLKYFFAFFAISLSMFAWVLTTELAWPVKLFAGFVIGVCHTGMAFITHEVLHGAIIKNKTWQEVVGFFGMGPFLISPTFWKFWHNRLHHGKTQLNIIDPDAFPTLGVYKRTPYIQKIFPWTPGSGYLRSYFYFFFWFSHQAFLNQLYMRFGNKLYNSVDHKRVTYQFYGQIAVCAFVLYTIGWNMNLLWLVVVPFAVQNYGVMSYISTNHNLSPLTKKNDPLVNSLTVLNHPFWEFVHLNFGYHVEHHIFPNVPASKNKIVHEELKRSFPDKFKVMPKWEAVKLLYSTPRIYNNRTELIHPETGETHPTI
jgi:fatty acid desaturase